MITCLASAVRWCLDRDCRGPLPRLDRSAEPAEDRTRVRFGVSGVMIGADAARGSLRGVK
jgi:hypothetical protein